MVLNRPMARMTEVTEEICVQGFDTRSIGTEAINAAANLAMGTE